MIARSLACLIEALASTLPGLDRLLNYARGYPNTRLLSGADQCIESSSRLENCRHDFAAFDDMEWAVSGKLHFAGERVPANLLRIEYIILINTTQV